MLQAQAASVKRRRHACAAKYGRLFPYAAHSKSHSWASCQRWAVDPPFAIFCSYPSPRRPLSTLKEKSSLPADAFGDIHEGV